MNNTNDIYAHTLKPYQIKKLFKFKKSTFPALYKCEDPRFTQLKYEYEICKYLWLNRFNEQDIVSVMAMWYKKHHIKPNWARLKNTIVPRSYLAVKSIIQQRRHEEYLRRKAKQLVATTKSAYPATEELR